MALQPMTRAHLEAVNSKDKSLRGFKLRAEYCEFMADTAASPHTAAMWTRSMNKRWAEYFSARDIANEIGG